MKEKLGLETAFPLDGRYASDVLRSANQGMSRRFYAACAAMQGLLGNDGYFIQLSNLYPETTTESAIKIRKHVAMAAFEYADYLLEKETEE